MRVLSVQNPDPLAVPNSEGPPVEAFDWTPAPQGPLVSPDPPMAVPGYGQEARDEAEDDASFKAPPPQELQMPPLLSLVSPCGSLEPAVGVPLSFSPARKATVPLPRPSRLLCRAIWMAFL